MGRQKDPEHGEEASAKAEVDFLCLYVQIERKKIKRTKFHRGNCQIENAQMNKEINEAYGYRAGDNG